MENQKHTQEYVEKLAEHLYLIDVLESYETRAYIQGYMKAIEETAAPDLLEALIEAKKELEYHNWKGTYAYNKINNAINKATK